MKVEVLMREKLEQAFIPDYLEVINESHGHNVPQGSETHFKVVLVSSRFEGLASINRHRLVYQLLQDEMAETVHALSVHAYTCLEWKNRGGCTPISPPCARNKKAETMRHNS